MMWCLCYKKSVRFQTLLHTSLGDLNNVAHITQMSHLISLIIHYLFISNVGNPNIDLFCSWDINSTYYHEN